MANKISQKAQIELTKKLLLIVNSEEEYEFLVSELEIESSLFIDSKSWNIGDCLGWKCWVCGKEFEICKQSKQEFCSISCFLDYKKEMDKRMRNYLKKTQIIMKGGSA